MEKVHRNFRGEIVTFWIIEIPGQPTRYFESVGKWTTRKVEARRFYDFYAARDRCLYEPESKITGRVAACDENPMERLP